MHVDCAFTLGSIILLGFFFIIIFADYAMILYVSRGLLSSLTDAREVMDVVSRYNARTGHKVIINTYAVIDGEFVGGHLFDLLSVLCFPFGTSRGTVPFPQNIQHHSVVAVLMVDIFGE